MQLALYCQSGNPWNYCLSPSKGFTSQHWIFQTFLYPLSGIYLYWYWEKEKVQFQEDANGSAFFHIQLSSLSSCISWANSVSSVAQSCPTLCNPMDSSMPGFPVCHQIPELAQTYVPWVCDATHPSHPLKSPFPPAFNLSQHQGLF